MIKARGYDQTTPQDWPKQAAVTNSGDWIKQSEADLIARESAACDHVICWQSTQPVLLVDVIGVIALELEFCYPQ